MTDDAPTGLGDAAPLRRLQLEAWSDLSDDRRDRLNELKREVDSAGQPVWSEWAIEEHEGDPDTWVNLILRPSDLRSAEFIGRWSKRRQVQMEDDERAKGAEHNIPPGAEH